MGNEQSMVDMKSRRSLDASFLRQVNTPNSSPRPSVVGQRSIQLPSGNGATTPILQHRASTDGGAELRYSKPKLSLTGREDMGNQQGRRLSRATVHLENGGEAGSLLVDALKLTIYQTQLLQSTWTRIKTNNNTFAQVFKLLSFKSTVCREMFQKMSIVEGFRTNQCCDMNMHAKVLCELLDSLMQDLNQPAKIVQARCMDIGASHLNMNEKCCGSLWDQLGECLTEVITKVECVRSKREAAKAWIILISYLVDSMKCGYMDEWRRKQTGRLST